MLSTVGVWASEGSDDSGFSGEYERLTDAAGLLSEEEAQNILTKLDEVSERQKFDIVILTVDSLEGATARSTQMISLIIMAMDMAKGKMEFYS